MVWLLTDKVLIDPLTPTPPVRLTGFPRFEPSIRNWTVPVGVPLPPLELTLAVKLTLCPNTEGLAEELTTVALVGLLTIV
jgi:hypothetical protein